MKSRVEVVCTTDDPVDTLEHHRAIATEQAELAGARRKQKGFCVQVRPTWRPDKSWAVGSPALFNSWTDKLGGAVSRDIGTLDEFMSALRERHDMFHAAGCRLSDRGVSFIPADDFTSSAASAIFRKARAGKDVSPDEARVFMAFMLHELAMMDAEKGWTMQVHFGVLRNNNSRMFSRTGPDSGFDSIGDWSMGEGLAKHLDRLDRAGKLPKTILYNNNPKDNELLAAMIGNFQDGITPGKMQFGSGWWFMDQLDGMTRQIEALSQMGLLSQFVGMLTDSRSFLSYARHEYFRRLLCSILGDDMARGRLPDDLALVGKIVADISYYNARNYFGFYETSK